MIQRLQTLYLLLGAGLLGCFLALVGPWSEAAAPFLPWLGYATTALAALGIAVGLLAIFLYKQRERQQAVILTALVLTLLLVLALGGALAYLHFQVGMRVEEGEAVGYFTLLLPVAAYLAYWMARRGVRRDIALVRSMDRLR
ncbi:MAG TPA: DUF4293 family protein [Rubricoccaceae bacterium]|nr:DUF4293 family protein [Rubricoccaceae bacterium]